MSGIFGDGILPGTPQPGAYLALVDFFGGDAARADAWLAAWIGYAGDAATAELLLAQLIASGPPGTASAALLIPSSSLEPQTLSLPTAPASEPATEAAPDSRVDFGAPF